MSRHAPEDYTAGKEFAMEKLPREVMPQQELQGLGDFDFVDFITDVNNQVTAILAQEIPSETKYEELATLLSRHRLELETNDVFGNEVLVHKGAHVWFEDSENATDTDRMLFGIYKDLSVNILNQHEGEPYLEVVHNIALYGDYDASELDAFEPEYIQVAIDQMMVDVHTPTTIHSKNALLNEMMIDFWHIPSSQLKMSDLSEHFKAAYRMQPTEAASQQNNIDFALDYLNTRLPFMGERTFVAATEGLLYEYEGQNPIPVDNIEEGIEGICLGFIDMPVYETEISNLGKRFVPKRSGKRMLGFCISYKSDDGDSKIVQIPVHRIIGDITTILEEEMEQAEPDSDEEWD